MKARIAAVLAAGLIAAGCNGKKGKAPVEDEGPPPWEFPGEEVSDDEIPANVKVEMSMPSVEGAHSEDAVRDALRPQLELLARCYERRLARHCKIKGDMRMKLQVSRTGPVLSIQVLSDTTRDTRLGDCISQIVKKADFGEAKAESTITVTYMFDPPPDVKCD
jgi:hypothetical protein